MYVEALQWDLEHVCTGEAPDLMLESREWKGVIERSRDGIC